MLVAVKNSMVVQLYQLAKEYDMKKVSFNKQMRAIYNRYLTSNYGDNLYKCYDRPSENKFLAMRYCEQLCDEYNGVMLSIIGYNCMQFSVGFEFTNENGENCFAYITKDHNRYCVID
jgi:hypothetical protein